jgi:hypothetical protein
MSNTDFWATLTGVPGGLAAVPCCSASIDS